MSVEVKRPQESALRAPDVGFRDRSQTLPSTVGRQHSRVARGRPNGPSAGSIRPEALGIQFNNTNVPGKINRRRRFSERTDSRTHSHGNRRNSYSRRGRERIVLPTKFLLGGNITDPLNLNSLNDEDINKALNEKTPVNSPLPTPIHRQQVHVIIPPNIRDPLGLNSTKDDPNLISPKSSSKKKRKYKNKRKSSGGEELLEKVDPIKPVSVDVSESDLSPEAEAMLLPFSGAQLLHKKPRTDKILDKIVSPVIPQTSPSKRKRKRTSSENADGNNSASRQILFREDSDKSDKVSPHRQKRRHVSQEAAQPPQPKPCPIKATKKQNRFIYGNYNRYYGYRNPAQERDLRLDVLKREWFEDKEILDIGCNAGHLTLAIAKDYNPAKVTGIDIDSHLISVARKNVRFYLSQEIADMKKFPRTMPSTYGPISAPVLSKGERPSFPDNVNFMQSNYVLEYDELLDLQHEEYDTVLALSITKWLHLNHGDDGLKRSFRRMYRQLRPGGRLILEPQSWTSYKKKKKLSETISENFKQIRLKPDQFTEYLLSREVGFSTCETLDVPKNKSKGFQRPIQVFVKSATAHPTPAYPTACSQCPTPVPALTDSCGNTPRFVFELDSRGCTPRFSGGSTTPCLSSRCSSGLASPVTVTTPRAIREHHDSVDETSYTPSCYNLRRTVSAPALFEYRASDTPIVSLTSVDSADTPNIQTGAGVTTTDSVETRLSVMVGCEDSQPSSQSAENLVSNIGASDKSQAKTTEHTQDCVENTVSSSTDSQSLDCHVGDAPDGDSTVTSSVNITDTVDFVLPTQVNRSAPTPCEDEVSQSSTHSEGFS